MTGWQLLKPHSEPVPDQRQTICGVSQMVANLGWDEDLPIWGSKGEESSLRGS